MYSAKRCTLLPLSMSSCFEWGPWENNGSAISYSILVENHGAHTLLGTVIHLFIAASVQLYFGLSLTLFFLSRLLEHTLCLEQLYSCLIQPLYTYTQTNLRVTYSGQTRGWSESTLFSDQWEHKQYNQSTNHRAGKVPRDREIGR